VSQFEGIPFRIYAVVIQKEFTDEGLDLFVPYACGPVHELVGLMPALNLVVVDCSGDANAVINRVSSAAPAV
jgi:hypothetical protein